MSEFVAPPAAGPAAERESWFEREVERERAEALRAESEAGTESMTEADEDELPDEESSEVEQDGPADPQEWLDRLTEELRRAEQGSFGSGPRDALAARIRLAQAYSELGDSVSAAPLAVQNVAQAEELFPSSEGMLAQLREFRDAACEAAGWTAAMMRTAEPEPVVVVQSAPAEPMLIDELTEQAAAAAAEAAFDVDVEADVESRGESDAETDVANDAESDAENDADGPLDAESSTAESSNADNAAAAAPESAPATTALALSDPEQIEDAEEVLAPRNPAIVDHAVYEEIVRLRYELRDAQRTIARLRHTNKKLREALEYEPE